jgi:eukaryotic-like serine/threonine-protein kinase
VNVTAERWQQIARIYELAVDQDAATLDAFLSEACAGDEALRREVESLLREDAAPFVVDRPVWATAAPLLDDGSDLRPGATLGPYRIESLLGAGGMGEVFRAIDTRLNRQVAIKVLPTGVALDQQMRARFAREARAVAALTHPHICTLYDVGRHDGVDFLVMEYLEGDTLASRLADGPLPLDQALTHAIEISSALDHAHRHGIIHRDLKPGNIMLTASGAKLLDFGLAKFRPAAGAGMAAADTTRAEPIPGTSEPTGFEQGESDDPHATRGGVILGTVRYMAPEQIKGREVDARSDLFSFGVLLYEMLTGKRAFDGDSATSVRAAILERDPPPVSSLRPLIPRAIDEIVRRCLAKDRDERWQTAGDLLRGLKRVSESGNLTHTRKAWTWMAAILLTAIVGLAAWAIAGGFQRWSTAQPAGQIRSIAVLPLDNLSGDPDQEYFADGITEQLIADLARIDGLRVIARTSVMQYRQARKPVPTIAQELQVDGIIEGSVLRAGDTVRITAKLIRGATGDIIWAKDYERNLRDVLALPRDVARGIASHVGITVTLQEQARLPSVRQVDPEVHRQVLLGRHHAAKATEEGLRKAVQYFDVAIAKDPANALAYAWLADAYTELNGFYMDPREAMPKAKRAAETALHLDETLADAYAALGYVHLVYDWNGPAAARALMRALDLNPNLPTARLNYAAYLSTQARHDEAAQEVRRALDLDPRSIRTHAFGTVLLLFTRRYDEALELARKGLEFEPDSAFTLAFQGVAYAELGKFEEAINCVERAATLDTSLTILAVQASVLARAGRKEQAETVIRRVQDASKHQYFCPYEIGAVYAVLDDADTASEFFRKGIDGHADCMAWLGVEPWIESFRSDPRYAGFLREIGLTPTVR